MGQDFCIHAYVVCTVSISVKVGYWVTSNLFNCCTGGQFKGSSYSSVTVFVVDAALRVWWSIAAVLFAIKGVPANNLGLPEKSFRIAVICLSFASVILFFCGTVVACCNCCRQVKGVDSEA